MIDWFVSRQKCIEGRGKISSPYIVCRIRSSFTEDFERTDPNEPDYFETIYPSIHSMVKQVAFWSNYFDKQTQNAKKYYFPCYRWCNRSFWFRIFPQAEKLHTKIIPKRRNLLTRIVHCLGNKFFLIKICSLFFLFFFHVSFQALCSTDHLGIA